MNKQSEGKNMLFGTKKSEKNCHSARSEGITRAQQQHPSVQHNESSTEAIA